MLTLVSLASDTNTMTRNGKAQFDWSLTRLRWACLTNYSPPWKALLSEANAISQWQLPTLLDKGPKFRTKSLRGSSTNFNLKNKYSNDTNKTCKLTPRKLCLSSRNMRRGSEMQKNISQLKLKSSRIHFRRYSLRMMPLEKSSESKTKFTISRRTEIVSRLSTKKLSTVRIAMKRLRNSRRPYIRVMSRGRTRCVNITRSSIIYGSRSQIKL